MTRDDLYYALVNPLLAPQSSSCLNQMTANESFNMGHYLKVPMGQEMYVPVVCSKDALNLMEEHNFDTVLNVPLSYHNTTTNRRTASTVVSDMFNSPVLHKVVTNKGSVYYGTSGLILDEEFNVLLIILLRIRKNVETSETYLRGIELRVSPLVFQRQEDLVCKSIIKEIIPIYLSKFGRIKSRMVTFWRQPIQYLEYEGIIMTIEDCNEWIGSPTAPSSDNPSEAIQEELSEIIEAGSSPELISEYLTYIGVEDELVRGEEVSTRGAQS